MLSSHHILCHPLLLLPPIPPSIRAFSNESTLHMRWPKYWSFSFSIVASKEIPGLISLRMDWLDLLAETRYLKLLANQSFTSHSSKTKGNEHWFLMRNSFETVILRNIHFLKTSLFTWINSRILIRQKESIL